MPAQHLKDFTFFNQFVRKGLKTRFDNINLGAQSVQNSMRSLFFVGFWSLLCVSWGQTASIDPDSTSLTPPTPPDPSEQVPTSTQDAALVSAGETLFKENCTVCHGIHEKVVGPALKDAHKRQPISWIKSFIKNSQKVIESGDEYANKLYEEYNQTQMTSFDFSDQELDALIAYIIDASAVPVAVASAEATATGTATSLPSGYLPSEYLNYILMGFIFVLLLIALTLRIVSQVLTKEVHQSNAPQAEKTSATAKTNWKKVFSSQLFLGLMIFLFIAVLVKSVLLDGLYGIGIQQNYQPSQPIAFSHKLHAGEYEIDCNYCHTGARKARAANIPSVNICMNCHGEIKKDSPEIQKLYTAIEKEKPIEWVRVHNLPDLAYFNHAQHVTVGKVECQTCHGPVEDMEVVYQYAPLTMGWCINCHKETQIDQDNNYYTSLRVLHEKENKKAMTVEDIGGLECSKCHY